MTRRLPIALAWSALVVLTGCGAERGGPPQRDRGALVPQAQPGDEIVALVDGRPICASQVAAQARAMGSDARSALASLVETEVLAGLAVDRGLLADPDVVDARKAESARRLLELDFEASTPQAAIPDAELRKSYSSNKLFFDREEVVEVWHLLAVAPAKGPPEARRIARDQLRALLPRATAATSHAAFAALATPAGPVPSPATPLAPNLPASIPMKAEQIAFPLHGVVEDSFAEAAFTLTTPGQVTGPIETSYGLHLIRLVKRDPARHVSFEAARAELRPGVWNGWRKRELDRYLHGLMEKWGAQIRFDRLVEAPVER